MIIGCLASLTFNCIQTLKFNLCEINDLVARRVYMFNQKLTFRTLKGILIEIYQEGSRYLDTNTNAKYINTHACNYHCCLAHSNAFK